MYKQELNQLTVYDFVAPFSGALTPGNRWVQFADHTDWLALEAAYAMHFSHGGKQAISVRCAFGSLVIQRALGLSDAQTVRMIAENPYLQYLIGMQEFSNEVPFSARTMARFRSRIPEKEVLAAVRRLDDRPRKRIK
ncbi:MAG: transposase [Pygmaiobacter sp.]